MDLDLWDCFGKETEEMGYCDYFWQAKIVVICFYCELTVQNNLHVFTAIK